MGDLGGMRVCVARTHEFGWLVASCDASVGMTRTDAVRRSEMGWPRRVGACVHRMVVVWHKPLSTRLPTDARPDVNCNLFLLSESIGPLRVVRPSAREGRRHRNRARHPDR